MIKKPNGKNQEHDNSFQHCEITILPKIFHIPETAPLKVHEWK